MRDPMINNDGKERSLLVREAAELWLRLQADPKDAALQGEAHEWRNQSAAHERAFSAAEETWALAGEMESLASPAIVTRPRRRNLLRSSRKRVATALASAAAVAGLAILAGPSLIVMWQSDYRTGTGEKRTVALEDGSSVMLDTGSAIALDYADGRRGVRLLAGRAWFDVAKNVDRPFTVRAAEAQVTVTGTAFDVTLDDAAINVALAEGGVRVAWDGSQPATMVPGDRLHITRPSHKITRSEVAVSSMGSWRRDRLLLENTSLSEGLAELERYYSGTIVVTSAALRQHRVTGVFDVRQPDEALRLMVLQHGAVVREVTPWLLVVSES